MTNGLTARSGRILDSGAIKEIASREICFRRISGNTFLIPFTNRTTGVTGEQFLDSGATRELVGLKYARRKGLKLRRLTEPHFMTLADSTVQLEVKYATWQKVKLQGTNGKAAFTVKYFVVDIDEEFVLGLSWLKYANPDVNWETGEVTWRHGGFKKTNPQQERETGGEENTPAVLPFKFRKARSRVVQGEIQANEPPAWVKEEFPKVLSKLHQDTLPPRRGDSDYKIQLKSQLVRPDGTVEQCQPRQERRRRFSPQDTEILEALEKQEVAQGRWVKSKSPWAAEMLLAAKAGGKKRPCIDFRPLNRWIVNDAYPLPFTKDMLHEVARHSCLTSLDLPKAYWNVRLRDNETEELMAFRCNGTLYQPRVMQFGTKTAVSWYQRFITEVLGDVIGHGAVVYLDNILAYGHSREENRAVTRKILARLQKAQLTVQQAKCEWEKEEVQFCGFLVGRGQIRLDPEKVKAVREWPAPQQNQVESLKTQLRGFLGFTNFYRDSIEGYSDIAEPLTTLTGKTVSWTWGNTQEKAFQALKEAVIRSPVLAARDPRLPVEAHTDASDRAIGATIEQRYDCGHTQPVAFYSKKLNAAQRNYDTYNRELMAIVEAFRAHRPWIQGSVKPVVVWSDHAALKHWTNPAHTENPRQMRWASELQDYDFEIRHVPGRANRAADALSRQGGESGVERENRAVLGAEKFKSRKIGDQEVSTVPFEKYKESGCLALFHIPILS